MDNTMAIYDYFLIGISVAFCALFLYTTCRLMCNCSIYGCQKGIVPLLTTTYILTLFTNALMILMIAVHQINIYTRFHQHDKIPDIIHIVGVYAILWLNCMLNCLTICCWFSLFADLFGLASPTTKRYIYTTLTISCTYFIIIIVVYILIEITHTLQLNTFLPILSYINLLPIILNLIIASYCFCKLPLSQPLDLDIGLYQKNTFCSCYTTVTQYIWCMVIISISQSIILIINILHIDLWNFATNDATFMHWITTDIAKLIYFISQFIALLFLWNFLGISIKQSFQLNILLDVLFTTKYQANIKKIDPEIKLNIQTSPTKSPTMTKLNSTENESSTKTPTEEQKNIETKINNNGFDAKQTELEESKSTSYSLQQEEHFEEKEIVNKYNVNKPPVQQRGRARIFTVTSIDPEHNFKITQPLGEGAYGPVFAAIDRRDQQMVALKVMSYNPQDCADLMSEINILRQCQSEYIVNFKDTFYGENNLIWLAMEYCDGGSILDVMKILNRNLTELQCACVIYQALKGLMYLHSKQLIHRDIKAANILVNSGGCCKLADFGVAKIMKASGVGTTIGSPYWMAPEVFGADNYDIAADIWSLGIVAIEMSIGKPPLSQYKPMQAMFMIPKNAPPTIPQYIVQQLNFSNGFVEFIARCLKKKANMRPNAGALIEDEWIRKVESNNCYKTELVSWINEAIPLLQKERAINAHIANQDNEEEEELVVEDDAEGEIELQAIQHQPTGTFMVMPTENDAEDNDNDEEEEDVYEESDVENTEVRHETETESSSEYDESEPSNVVIKF